MVKESESCRWHKNGLVLLVSCMFSSFVTIFHSSVVFRLDEAKSATFMHGVLLITVSAKTGPNISSSYPQLANC